MKLIRSARACAAALMCLGSLFGGRVDAEQSLEVLALRHRTVEQVLPILQPLLEPGGALTGQSGQLIVRASPGNLREIRAALDAIDRPPRRLQISVRFDDASMRERQALEASGRVGSAGSRIEVRAQEQRGTAQDRVDQRIQVIEGGRALIRTGQTRTLPQRQVIQTPSGTLSQQTYVVQEAATGMEVVPFVAGENVTLQIAPQRETPGPAGTVQGSRVVTTVSGRLGEWMVLATTAESATRSDTGLGSGRQSAATQSSAVWVKVEEVQN